MGIWQAAKTLIKRGRPRSDSPYAKVTARVSEGDGVNFQTISNQFQSDLIPLMATFPFQVYELIDNLVAIDPYIAKFHHTTVVLGNTGHKLRIDAPNEALANEAIQEANNLAARCYPWAGGIDGLVNGLFSQVARSGGLCVEWVPSNDRRSIQQAFLVPVKTIRFRLGKDNSLVLCQDQTGMFGGGKQSTQMLTPLNPTQTTFHAACSRDGNPYPIPPVLPALEYCAHHRGIMSKIRTWMTKLSALGVLIASVEPPPREPGETQGEYDQKAAVYLKEIADSVSENLDSGMGVGYKNIEFAFQNTNSGAQGAKDLLQIVLQGLFAALQRDPVFFGWSFRSTETYARVVYEEMLQGIRNYQLGVKRALENGHRLNFALNGFGSVGVAVEFNAGRSLDNFNDAEAGAMDANKMKTLIDAGVIDKEEARGLLGLNDMQAKAGDFVASLDQQRNLYVIDPFVKRTWNGSGVLGVVYGKDENAVNAA